MAASTNKPAASDGIGYCASCGAKVAGSAAYCASCGHQVRSEKTPSRREVPTWLKASAVLVAAGFFGEIGTRGGAAVLAFAFDVGEGSGSGSAAASEKAADDPGQRIPEEVLDFLQPVIGPAFAILALLACVTAVLALLYDWLLPDRPLLAGAAFAGLLGGIALGIVGL